MQALSFPKQVGPHMHPPTHETQAEQQENTKTDFHFGSLGNLWGFPCFHGDDKEERNQKGSISERDFSRQKYRRRGIFASEYCY